MTLSEFQFEGLLATALHVLAASIATVHVLLRKRDVPAAIGWIGVAWLSPIFGAALYFAFGVNRVHRKARRLRGVRPSKTPSPDARELQPQERLASAIGSITGLERVDGVVEAVLQSGDEAYPAMLAAIAEAKVSVELSTFIFRTDEAGLPFVEALAAAHRRGVAVRVLIDGMGGGYFRSAAWRALVRRGVPAARFLHSAWPWRMPLLDLRLHKKALIIDRRAAFVGGLNIAAENLLARPTRWPVRDTHFRISGAVVDQIADSFDEDWAFTTGGDIEDTPSTPTADGPRARAIVSGPDQAVDRLVLALLSAVSSARRTIRIATPYFLPDERLVTALQVAALRGVEVSLVTPATNNHRLVAWASDAHVRPLLESGCRLYRSGPPFDHSKLMTIDDIWCLIGSANWDARSLRLNFELTIELYDAALATRLSDLIDSKRAVPFLLEDLDREPLLFKLRNASARLAAPYL
ncbi:phospholipase D-like domain-containing protein [Chelatococcus sambhunathii]|uniref:phospholipase D-like domain-containing protein n=1 Tax=Chelatococcus sambhunathii TaxID=363953 RepID=UPI002852A318|nr:phospholipase D-like domain-containing protein [Chelatococcus sambhunathii]